MTRFLEKIKKQQLACNAILITKFLIFGMLIFLLTFILFFLGLLIQAEFLRVFYLHFQVRSTG